MSVFGDPATQMAFSVHENKGVFALLLGSGLSRAAEIPTGWEITTDLVRRMATAQGVEPQDDWGKWYFEKEGKVPNYSELLAQLATTPAERRAILHSYIEPDEEDREEGRKVPTSGHKAIAKLVRDGHIRVIVTTNFDRLMENALRDVGVEPTVITSPDVLQGAEPLTHSACYILKVHGDYKDARILNTDDELDAYPDAYNTLLDRIFDEHGLIVCGWSGEWDHALRAAISRVRNRRYPLFWAVRGDLKGRGKELCESRKGLTVPISDADTFFVKLVEQVETLAQSKRQNPVGVEMLVNRAKRYLAKPEHRIQLSDLISDEVLRIVERLEKSDMGSGGTFSAEEFQRRVEVYEGATEGLAKICGLVGRWGDAAQIQFVVDAIGSLVDHAGLVNNGSTVFLNMRTYPAVLSYQACALGMTNVQNWSQLHAFMGVELDTGYDGTMRMIDAVSPSLWKGEKKELWQNLPDFERRHTPLSDHFADDLFETWGKAFRSSTGGIVIDCLMIETLTAIRYLETNDIAALRSAHESETDRNYIWSPVRRAGWDRNFRQKIKPKFENADFLRALTDGGFGRGDTDFVVLAIESHERLIGKLHWSW
ncbi:SIR2 family protein [Lentibacter algarum]|uniref:SIR2 family protein n=1 Tax=Lentibacter algarum TaxID=576131 RepID=UPI001C07C132|nr:SIR2 family protein [Lentibacter algarum]MBU2981025.1 SIR2 family protein [Lentibacter algarum]